MKSVRFEGKGANSNRRWRIDKSAFKLKNSFQNIQSSPDLSGELFCFMKIKWL
jgi:hypothetical protein